MQVHSQLTLVCRAGQSQLILVENGADCRSERFRLQVVTGKGSLYNSFTDQGFDAYSAYHNDPVKFAKIVEEMANIKL